MSAFLFFLRLTSILTGSRFYASTIQSWFVRLVSVFFSWLNSPEFELLMFIGSSFESSGPELDYSALKRYFLTTNFHKISPTIRSPPTIMITQSSSLSYQTFPAGFACSLLQSWHWLWSEQREHPSMHGSQ
jgi:hypothetical protein